jgi:hypothetical protein
MSRNWGLTEGYQPRRSPFSHVDMLPPSGGSAVHPPLTEGYRRKGGRNAPPPEDAVRPPPPPAFRPNRQAMSNHETKVEEKLDDIRVLMHMIITLLKEQNVYMDLHRQQMAEPIDAAQDD